MLRALRVLSVALVTAGLLVLADVGLTLVWKEPVSTVYGMVEQGQAEGELADLEESFPSAGDLRAIRRRGGDRRREVELLAERFARQAASGGAVGRIRIDSIGIDYVLVEGTETGPLRNGPGHYSPSGNEAVRRQGDGSAMPGEGETVGIAGHRTTYLAPFRHIDEISEGEEIEVEMPYGSFSYEVEGTRIVPPDEIGVVRDVGYERLVLTACHPLYSAAQRYVVFARLREQPAFGDPGAPWQDP